MTNREIIEYALQIDCSHDGDLQERQTWLREQLEDIDRSVENMTPQELFDLCLRTEVWEYPEWFQRALRTNVDYNPALGIIQDQVTYKVMDAFRAQVKANRQRADQDPAYQAMADREAAVLVEGERLLVAKLYEDSECERRDQELVEQLESATSGHLVRA